MGDVQRAQNNNGGNKRGPGGSFGPILVGEKNQPSRA